MERVATAGTLGASVECALLSYSTQGTSLAEGPSSGISSTLRQSVKTSGVGQDTSYFVHLRSGVPAAQTGKEHGPLSYR